MWLSVHHFTVGQKKWHINGFMKAVAFFSQVITQSSCYSSLQMGPACAAALSVVQYAKKKKDLWVWRSCWPAFTNLKSPNTFSKYLKWAKRDKKNHILIEKLMGGFLEMSQYKFLFKIGLTPMLQLMLLRALSRWFLNIFKDRYLTRSPRNVFQCRSIIKRKYFLLCLIRVYLAAACSHLISLCPSKTTALVKHLESYNY